MESPTAENTYKNAEPRILHATVVVSKVISRNVVRSQVLPKRHSNRENQSSSTGPKHQNYAAAVALQADSSMREASTKNTDPQQYIQQCNMVNMNILMKVHNPSNAILISEDGVEIQNTSTSTSDPAPVSVSYSRFSLYRISVHGNSNPISNRFFQHFRYFASERKHQFFE